MEGEQGYCRLRIVTDGLLLHLAGTAEKGLLQWYRDPLPTNCVADWVCDGSKMFGYHNLAVFYGSCTFNCLFCQNWQYRDLTAELGKGVHGKNSSFTRDLVSADGLANITNEKTFCVCFFGGDPSSQMPHALSTARLLANRGVRICWETNGSMHRKFLKQAIELSLETGGIIKFDIKAFSPGIHFALTGAHNLQTLENFAFSAGYTSRRQSPPLLIASTLLVPGYVDNFEVAQIANYIAKLDPEIPYALLAFHPEFYMNDLPTTSRRQAEEALKVAREAGLKNVRLGNTHLLQ